MVVGVGLSLSDDVLKTGVGGLCYFLMGWLFRVTAVG